jgi:hypothetical protein
VFSQGFSEEAIKTVADGDKSVISEIQFSDTDSSEDDGNDSVSSRTNSGTNRSLSGDYNPYSKVSSFCIFYNWQIFL